MSYLTCVRCNNFNRTYIACKWERESTPIASEKNSIDIIRLLLTWVETSDGK